MTDAKEPAAIRAWHAHIYYDPAARETATWLRERLSERFPEARLGRWHDGPVGPHAGAMYQVAFATGDAPSLIPFLALNRRGLTILVHPDTGRPKEDHLEHALWMGAVLPLAASILPDSE